MFRPASPVPTFYIIEGIVIMKNTKHILATAVVTSLGMSSSSLANEQLIEEEFATDKFDGKATKLKDSKIGYQSEGGLLGSGFCCADCRDIEI